jgi:hypothetical protein
MRCPPHLLEKLFRKKPLGYREERFDEHPQVVAIAFLEASPNAREVANDDRERI